MILEIPSFRNMIESHRSFKPWFIPNEKLSIHHPRQRMCFSQKYISIKTDLRPVGTSPIQHSSLSDYPHSDDLNTIKESLLMAAAAEQSDELQSLGNLVWLLCNSFSSNFHHNTILVFRSPLLFLKINRRNWEHSTKLLRSDLYFCGQQHLHQQICLGHRVDKQSLYSKMLFCNLVRLNNYGIYHLQELLGVCVTNVRKTIVLLALIHLQIQLKRAWWYRKLISRSFVNVNEQGSFPVFRNGHFYDVDVSVLRRKPQLCFLVVSCWIRSVYGILIVFSIELWEIFPSGVILMRKLFPSCFVYELVFPYC